MSGSTLDRLVPHRTAHRREPPERAAESTGRKASQRRCGRDDSGAVSRRSAVDSRRMALVPRPVLSRTAGASARIARDVLVRAARERRVDSVALVLIVVDVRIVRELLVGMASLLSVHTTTIAETARHRHRRERPSAFGDATAGSLPRWPLR